MQIAGWIRMQVEIYADVVFVINLAMDFFILFITGKIFRKKMRLLRLILGAATASILYCVMIFITPFSVWLNIFSSVAIISCGIFVGFYPFSKREFIKLLVTAHIVAFAVGGCTMALTYYTDISKTIGNAVSVTVQNFSVKVLIASVCVSYVGLKLIIAMVQKYSLQKQVFYQFYICLAGKKTEMTGLVDTGNSLVEPISGFPVIVAEYMALKDILPSNAFIMFENKRDDDLQTVSEQFADGVLVNRIRFIPYLSLGEKNGVLIGFRPDMVEIVHGKKIETKKNVIIGICNFKLSGEGDYGALINPALVKE